MPPAEPRTLSADLQGRTPEQLAELLAARPDVRATMPTSLGRLATCCGDRASVAAAISQLNAAELAALTAVAINPDPVTTAAISQQVGRDASALLEQLWLLALIWGTPDSWALPNSVRGLLVDHGLRIGVLDRQVAQFCADPASFYALMAQAPPAALQVIHELRTASTAPLSSRDQVSPLHPLEAVDWLLERHVAVRVGNNDFAIPVEIATLLHTPPELAHPMRLPSVDRPRSGRLVARAPADREGAIAAQAAVDLVGEIARIWALDPAIPLVAGGLGVREVNNLALRLGIPQPELRLLVEVSAAAGLVGYAPDPDSTSGGLSVIAPTADYQLWSAQPPGARWAVLALAWLQMRRRTHPGTDRPVNLLSQDAGDPQLPELRTLTLANLAEDPPTPGTAPVPPGMTLALDAAEMSEMLAWQRPWRPLGTAAAISAILAEAQWLGITAMGALTTAGRDLLTCPRLRPRTADQTRLSTLGQLLADGATAAAAVAPLLPAPVDSAIVQADLTIVVPGTPVAELADFLTHVANVESRGGAARVLRITPARLRAALAAGMDADEIRAGLRRWSATEIPQALDFLIGEVASQYGRLRTGRVGSYLRSVDPAAVAAILADPKLASLGLFLLAPGVLGSAVDEAQLRGTLARRGYQAVPEAPDGEVTAKAERVNPARSNWSLTGSYGGAPQPVTAAQCLPEARALLATAARQKPAGKARRPARQRRSGNWDADQPEAITAILTAAMLAGEPVTLKVASGRGVSLVDIFPQYFASGMVLGLVDGAAAKYPLSHIIAVRQD